MDIKYRIVPVTLLQQAAEALRDRTGGSDQQQRVDLALADLYDAMAPEQAEPAQEPVAWMVEGSLYASKEVAQKMGGNAYTLQALYTTPPQRPPLTDEEIDAITRDRWGAKLLGVMVQMHREYARVIERKVRGEKE